MKIEELFHDRLQSALLEGSWRMMKMALVAGILTGNLVLAGAAWVWMAFGSRGLV